MLPALPPLLVMFIASSENDGPRRDGLFASSAGEGIF
jgi:hypothetical protein